jgi:hypothetical protein
MMIGENADQCGSSKKANRLVDFCVGQLAIAD